MLYCWGDGSSGQLGLGEEVATAPTSFRRGPEAIGGREVLMVACGERHTLLLFTDGSVASCGDNALGQLGRRLPQGRQRCYVPEFLQLFKFSSPLYTWLTFSSPKITTIHKGVCANGSLRGNTIGVSKYLKGCHVDGGADLFSVAPEGRTRTDTFKLQGSRFWLDTRKNFLAVRVVQQWNSLSLEMVGSSSLAVLKQRHPDHLSKLIQALETQSIVHVSCGKEHSLATCSNGKVFSWGAGTFGQLGTGGFGERLIPKKIDGLSMLKVIQVACGHYHSVALTKDGRVFSWGQNIHGQLGLGKDVSNRATPQHITALDGIPLAQVAAGGGHSFALSLSGVAYGWGRNNAHQLGLSQAAPKVQVFKPCSVAALRNLDVIYISCGDEHTAVLTQSGSIFTFGDNSAGQLGYSSSAQTTGPQKVDWIDGPVSHLACGSYHTLVCLSASGQLISFGHGPLQHSGNGTSASKQDDTQSFNISALVSPNELSGIQVKRIFAGIYVNFASVLQPQKAPTCANRISSSTEALPKISQVDRLLIQQWMSATAESEMRQKAKREVETIFSSSSCLTASFLKPRSALEITCCIAVDLQKAEEVLKELTQKDWIAGRICFSLLNQLIPALPLDSPHQEALSSFLLLPVCSAALEAQTLQSLAMPFAKAVSKISKRSSDILEKYWSLLPAPFFDQIVQMLKKAVVSQLPYYFAYPHCQEVIPVLEILKNLYKVNKKANYKLQISNFYIRNVAKDIWLEDLRRWHLWRENRMPATEAQYPVSFCRFPFVFDVQTKIIIFHWESFFQQQRNIQQTLINNQLRSNGDIPSLPYFHLRVQRRDLVESALRRLNCVEDAALKMPLMVEFEGEKAMSAVGGVILEFFLYIFEEMTHPDYGMFMYCEPNSPMWFPTRHSADKSKYFLFGILYGLSLFNRVVAYVPFPLAAFKKLIGKKPSLDDLKELSPVQGRSLQAVLDYEHDDIEENFQLYYTIFWDNKEEDLIQNGSSVAVNNANKKDYVNKYVDYVFNKSVDGVFEEFKRGFYKVLDKRVVGFFEPQELMVAAIGNENYDWDMLEKNTMYWGIYSPQHPTIRMFWKVFHELTLDVKKGFLLFVSGSNRIPVTGMESMQLKIHSQNSLSEDHMPEAQTCFNVLYLPRYSTIEKLKEKLLQAIENNRGFGK